MVIQQIRGTDQTISAKTAMATAAKANRSRAGTKIRSQSSELTPM
ncbi:hypothetical protein ACPOL_3371 [Acidisarcina polymorpha]|uniref:Uncharacterized protein n=1 Tax=Acidisarcina polymorpha TaxID=2211140 RepID=A0A2Z5G0X9_9BACT|nr:hypothetical protein ACPOL_3371 [Acidisarcina polymorpha]